MIGEHAATRDRARAVLQLLDYADVEGAAERLAAEEERLRRESVRLSPGARETLSALRGLGLRIGAASNGTNIWRIFLAGLEIESYFDVIGISCELGRCKPEPELFLWVTERLGVEPEECVYVGDGDGGELEAARDLGMTAVLIDQPWSWARQTGRSVYHDRRITHLGELLRIVAGSS
jgi:HAD superfamily hydrolase (TIGR01509 family)